MTFVAAMKGALAGTPFQLLGIEDDPATSSRPG